MHHAAMAYLSIETSYFKWKYNTKFQRQKKSPNYIMFPYSSLSEKHKHVVCLSL